MVDKKNNKNKFHSRFSICMDIIYKVSVVDNLIENLDDFFDKLAINYNYFKILIKEAHFRKIKILINLKIEYDLNEIKNIKKLFDHIKLWLDLDIDGFSLDLNDLNVKDKKDFLEKFKDYLLENYGVNKILIIYVNFSKSKDIIDYFNFCNYLINDKIN